VCMGMNWPRQFTDQQKLAGDAYVAKKRADVLWQTQLQLREEAENVFSTDPCDHKNTVSLVRALDRQVLQERFERVCGDMQPMLLQVVMNYVDEKVPISAAK